MGAAPLYLWSGSVPDTALAKSGPRRPSYAPVVESRWPGRSAIRHTVPVACLIGEQEGQGGHQ